MHHPHTRHPTVSSPVDAPRYPLGPVTARLLLSGKATGQAFELWSLKFDFDSDEPVVIPFHVHRHMDETLYVTDGQFEFTVGVGPDGPNPPFRPGTGVSVHIPRNNPHGFKSLSPGRVLVLFTPATGQEGYYRELSATAADRAAGRIGDEELMARVGDIEARHDQVRVGA